MRASHVAQHWCCLHKSSRVSSEKSATSQRFLYDVCGAGVTVFNASKLEICAGWWSWRYDLNVCKLESELVDPCRLKGTSFPTPRDGGRSHESDASTIHDCAVEGLTRQHTELQNELNQSRQQAANELAALRQEVRGAPLRGTRATGVGVDTRLPRKPSDFSGAQDAWRDWCTVFKGYAGAAIPRLQKRMDDAAKATAPTPNATILDDDDRAAAAQLY